MFIKKIFLIIVTATSISLLISCDYNSSDKLNIYPLTLKNKKSTELGSFIKDLMPPDNKSISWGWLSEDPRLIWLDDGIKSENNINTRRAVVRINVMGEVSTSLMKNTNELAWLLSYSTTNDRKCGPEIMELKPGLDGSEQCFGTLYSWCSFNIFPSLKAAGVTIKEICPEISYGTGNYAKIFLMKAKEKKPTYIKYDFSSGSGGNTSSISILLVPSIKEACKG
jgi:hypothetical protein